MKKTQTKNIIEELNKKYEELKGNYTKASNECAKLKSKNERNK